ncbi:MAG: DUF3987 domain-containing protein [Nitrospiraceae bacterium]
MTTAAPLSAGAGGMKGNMPTTVPDLLKLGKHSWIDQLTAERFDLRRVDTFEGAALVGRNDNEDYAGIVFAVYWPGDLKPREYFLRRDHPPIENGKPKGKYLAPPGRGNKLLFGPGESVEALTDPTTPIVLVEGLKKLLAGYRLARYESDHPRFLPCAISGVWNWKGTVGKTTDASGVRVDEKGVIPDFDRITWAGRAVVVIFDSDCTTNAKVAAARRGLIYELRKRGAKVAVVDLPAVEDLEITGLDDYLAREGPEAALELIQQAIEAAQCPSNEPTIPIPLDIPIPAPMPLYVLPSALNSMVQTVAAHTETPPELAAGFGLAVVATACQQRIIVQVEPGYTEPLSVWPTTALESGNRKTAAMMPMVAPLIEAERRLCDLAREKILTVESERETIKAKVKALREATAKKKGYEDFEDKKQEITQLEATMPEVPTLPRLWVQDITTEKLGQVMAENKERLALISDEGGLFDTLAGRYSNGVPNLDLFLQAHAGSPVRVHRGSRPDVVMDRPALTIALSPQPSVLQGLATQPGFRGRGLLARFLYALPISRLGYRTLTSQPIPPSIKNLYQDTITTLLKIEPATAPSGEFIPHVLTLSPEAHAEWKEFQHTVEKEMRDGGEYEHIRDWAGKLPGAAARLAGILHCAEHAETLLSNLTITITTMQRALSLAAFYKDHALVAFDLMGADPDLEKARHVWRWIERIQKSQFTARECFQALRGTYKKMEKLNPAFPVLIERGYLIEREPPPETLGKPGRKTRVFLVNPDALKVPS